MADLKPEIQAKFSEAELPPVGAPPRTIAGYNLLSWSENGVTYWAVSDVAVPDLDAFAKAFRSANP